METTVEEDVIRMFVKRVLADYLLHFAPGIIGLYSKDEENYQILMKPGLRRPI
jgi:hypothetical protein